MIKLVKVQDGFYELCKEKGVSEQLPYNKSGRPCVLLIRLRYKGSLHDFVVPLQSHIKKNVPRDQYLPLPPSPYTQKCQRSGLHYYKLFPVNRNYVDKFLIENNAHYERIYKILNRHEKDIIKNCQNYLENYENGNKHFVTPDIDGILSVLPDKRRG